MNQKTLSRISIILLIVTVSFAYGGGDDGYDNDNYDRDGYDDKYDGKSSKNRQSKDEYNYNGGLDEYYKEDTKVTGVNGNGPRKDDVSYADFGPPYSKGGSPMSQSMNIWIYAVDDWDRKSSRRYGGKRYDNRRDKYNKKYDNKDYKDNDYKNNDYKGNDYKNDGYKNNDYKGNDYKDDGYKNNDYKGNDYKNDGYKNNDYKGNDYKDNDYKDNDKKGEYRKKRSYSKLSFPVKQIKNYRKFPFNRFPPLISIAPWLPIFFDKVTYQTFIFSPTGGLYIIPPLINFYGRRFAVAQLIKWGYASLVSSGVPPPPAINVAPLVEPVPAAVPVPAGDPGPADTPRDPPPTYNSQTNQYNGGVKTDYPDFKPRPNQIQDAYNNPGPNYGSGSGYGSG